MAHWFGAAPERVFDAWVTQADADRFLVAEMVGAPAGIERPRKLVVAATPGTATIELAPSGTGTLVALTHEGVARGQEEPVAAAWRKTLDALEAILVPRVMAVAFLRMVADGQVREAYRRYVGNGFKHHNPYFRQGAEELMAAMEENAAIFPHRIFEVQRALAEGELAAVHSRMHKNLKDPGATVVHLFRFAEERIVELWEVAQPVPDGSRNGDGVW